MGKITALILFAVSCYGQADFALLAIEPRASASSPSSLNTNLIAYWKFDEASGTRADSEPTGTPQDLSDSTTVPSTTGKISNGGAFEYDDAEYVSRADSADMSLAGGDQSFTVAAWVNLESKPAFAGGIVCKNSDAGNGTEYNLFWDADTDRFSFRIGNGSSSTTVPANTLGAPSLSTWYLLVAWHDGPGDTIYIQANNGAADPIAWVGGTQDAGTDLRIGAYSFNPGFAFDGIIDEVGFWKRTLTVDERTELYNAGTGKTCCPF